MGTQSIVRVAMMAATLLVWQSPAIAAASTADIAVAVKSLGFIGGLDSGTQEVMVLYDPGNAASRADAETVANALEHAKGKLSFKPLLTSVGNIGNAPLAYISEGMGAHFGAIRSAAAAHNIFTFTHDRACVVARACAMYVSASPSVTIETSQSALAATRYEPAAALKMMIKEAP